MPAITSIAYGVVYVGSAVAICYKGWRFAVRYLDYRNTLTSIEKVKTKLQELGLVTPEAINDLVKHLVDKGIDVPAGPKGPGKRLTCNHESGQRVARELTGLMEGAPVPRSRSVMRTGLVICLSFVQEVLEQLNPIRKAGQPVAAGDEGWVLERLLGIDHIGEVWLGTRSEHKDAGVTSMHQLRAFRFFTKEGVRQKMLADLRDVNGTLLTLGAHSHIVHFYHLAVYDNQYPYLALEYVPGGSLDDWILEKPEHRVPLRKHEVIEGVISAVSRAHELGIYHHGLSPRKLLLSDRFEPEEKNKKPKAYDVQAKVADFGLAGMTAGARAAQEPANSAARGADAPCRCTTPYLPPEADEESDRSPAQDDVFALGVIWYQLLVERIERPPYDFADRLRDDAGADDQTIRIISRCLAGPDRRYRTAQQLEEDVNTSEVTDLLPKWPPTPKGVFDVSHLVRDYIATLA